MDPDAEDNIFSKNKNSLQKDPNETFEMSLGGLGVDQDYEEVPDTEGMDDEDKGGFFLNDDVVNKLVDITRVESPRAAKPKQ